MRNACKADRIFEAQVQIALKADVDCYRAEPAESGSEM
jgi:hypothetical protein